MGVPSFGTVSVTSPTLAPELAVVANCGKCGKHPTVIGYEETDVLDVRPTEHWVKVIRREKRACRDCER